jgi:flagellar motor component MotA
MSNFKQSSFIARSVGIVSIALGFVVGMYGLEHPDSMGLNTALGLIATGLLAQGYALYCTLRRAREQHSSGREDS